MSSLLLKWINEELQISVPVTSLEKDFANGFLFGEILFRFNQIQPRDLDRLVRASTSDAKIQNFCMIEPVIRNLNVKFDSQLAHGIMQQKKGVASKLLYQIKMALDKLAKTSATVSLREEKEGRVRPLPNMPMRAQKPFYDKGAHAFFEKSIRVLVENPNETMMGRTTAKYEQERANQEERALQAVLQQKADLQAEKDERRMERLHKHKAQHEAMHAQVAVDESGTSSWKANMERKAYRDQMSQLNTEKMMQKKDNKIASEQQKHREDLISGVDEFERNLLKFKSGGEPQTSSPSPGKGPETMDMYYARIENSGRLPDSVQMQRDLDSQLGKIKEKKVQNQKLSKARELRRRKYLTKMRQDSLEHSAARRVDKLAELLVTKSMSETDIDRQVDNAQVYKNIVIDNRAFRAKQYDNRETVDRSNLLERDRGGFSAQKNAHIVENERQQGLNGSCYVARVNAVHSRNTEYCQGLVLQLVNLALSVADFRETSNLYGGDPMPGYSSKRTWKDMERLFVDGSDKSSCLASAKCWAELGQEGQPAADLILKQELSDYVAVDAANVNSDVWPSLQLTAFVAASPNAEDGEVPAEDVVATPATEGQIVTSLNSLGDLIEEVRVKANPLPERTPVPVEVPRFSLQLILCGKEFTYKENVANLLANEHKLVVLSAEAILKQALETTSYAPLGDEALALLQGGEVISDDLYARLLKAAIKDIPEGVEGWILHDYPNTIAQAQALEHHLSGFPGTGQIPSKADCTSGIAPSSSQAPPLDYKSIIDIVLIMDDAMTAPLNHALVDRSLGRRVNPKTSDQYHLQSGHLHDVPEDENIIKESLVPVEENARNPALMASRLAGYELHTPTLQSWFGNFGITRKLTQLKNSAQPADLCIHANSHILDLQGKRVQEEAKAQESEKAQSEARAEEAEKRVKEIKDTAEALAEAQTSVETLESEKSALEDSLKATKDKEEKATIAESITTKTDELTAAQDKLVSAQETQKALDDKLQSELEDEKAANPYVLPSALGSVLSEQWDVVEQNYLSGLNEFFVNLRCYRSSEIKHLSDVRLSFAEFLRRPDEKQRILGAFQSNFNAITQDMRFDPAVKNELHLRASELKDSLQEICTRKKQEAEDEHKAIATDGWVEAETTRVSLLYIKAMQSEIDRCYRTVQLCKDFYKGQTKDFPAVDGILEEVAETPCPPNISELFEGENIFAQDGDGGSGKDKKGKDKKGKDKKETKGKDAAEDDPDADADPFPKLSTVFEAAIAAIDAFAAGADNEQDDKKKGKKDKKEKGGKGKKDKGDDEDVPTVDPAQQAALRQTLDVQGVLTRARVARLRACAVSDLGCLRADTTSTYATMAQWTATRLGNEESTIEVVVNLAQETIENEAPFVYNFRIEDVSDTPTYEIAKGPVVMSETSWPRLKANGMTGGNEDLIFYQNERLVPETQRRPPAQEERISSTTFSREQVQILTSSFVGSTFVAGNPKVQYQMGRCSIDTFVDLMMRLAQEDSVLPGEWKKVRPAGFRKIATAFDEENDNTGTSVVYF
jgi:hypothetical protein